MAEESESTEVIVSEETSLLGQRRDSDSRTKYHTSRRRSSQAAWQPEPHLSYHNDNNKSFDETEDAILSSLAVWVVIPVSLLGVFVANADGSLVVASSQQIASEFDALSNAQWLVTSYGLAQCASQSLYGKLSVIFGRKPLLIAAYLLFAIGCLLCGIGQTITQVFAGRAISGVGGAGMTALVSVIIADLVPVRDVAAWRSYVNVAATTGRALGGPVGGWLCDTIGWRWCFYGQVPLTLLGLILILWKMPPVTVHGKNEETLTQKFRRIDILGALSLAFTITAFLLCLDFGSKDVPRSAVIISGVAFVVTAVIFYAVERYWAAEPILPLRLLFGRVALTSNTLAGLQMCAQFGTFYSTPLFFQIATDMSVAQSGARLVPAVAGNALAGLLAGWYISKRGRYKWLTVGASIFASIGYLLICLFWRGPTNWFEALFVFAGGAGSGAIQSTTFIHLAANLDQDDMAIAGTTLYLAQNVCLLVGIQTATTILHTSLKHDLDSRLDGFKNKKHIIKIALSSVKEIRNLPETVRNIVQRAYIDGLTLTFGASFVYAVLGVAVGLTIKEKRLD